MSDDIQQTDAAQDGQTDGVGDRDGVDVVPTAQTDNPKPTDTSKEDEGTEDVKPPEGDATGEEKPKDGETKDGDEGDDEIALSDEEEDLTSLQEERDKDKAPKDDSGDTSRRDKRRENIWDEDAVTNGAINPAKVLQLSKDPFAKKGLEAFATKHGYASGDELLAEISKSAKVEDVEIEPDSRTDQMWRERGERQKKDFFGKQGDERTEYVNWKKDAVKEIGKEEWDNHKDAYVVKRDERVKSGQSLIEAGKATLNEIHIKILKASSEKKKTDPSLEIPEGEDKETKKGSDTQGRMSRSKYFAIKDDDKRAAYAKKHSVNGVVQFASG